MPGDRSSNIVDVTVDAEWMDSRICWHATAIVEREGARDGEMEVSEKGRAWWGVCERRTDRQTHVPGGWVGIRLNRRSHI